VLLFTGVADAEPPASAWTVTAGLGVAWSHLRSETLDAGFTPGLSARGEVGYRVDRHVALGVHAGLASATGHEYPICEDPLPGAQPYTSDYSYTAFELGLTAELVFDEFRIAPWVGISSLSGGSVAAAGNAKLGYGVVAGYGIYRTLNGHYLDIFASAMRSTKDNPDSFGSPPFTEPFTSFAAGVDFRY
jgi:hypothetical protein